MTSFRFRTYTYGVPLSYTPVALLPLSSVASDSDAIPSSINSNGVVVGQGIDSSENRIAAKWTLTSPKSLGTLGGSVSHALSINDAGSICGYAEAADGGQRAVLWQRDLIRDLGTLTGTSGNSQALALSPGSDPVVFGESMDAQQVVRAVRWSGLNIGILPQDPDWTASSASCVGPNAAPAGWARLTNGEIRAYYWDQNPIELPGLPGATETKVTADYYEVSMFVGFSNGGGPSQEAVFFDPGAPAVSMHNLAGAQRSRALGVNAFGVAVGEYYGNTISSGFVFSRYGAAQMLDLTSRLSDTSLVDKILAAHDINNDGVITATAEDANGVRYAVLLLPN